MKKVIKIKYDSENKKTYIYYENEFVDSSVIDDKEISQWVYPFIIKNKRWDGIYAEMKELCQSEEFIVIFIGDESDYEILSAALKDTKAELLKINNKVEILYDNENKSVTITINGQIFDTSKIDGTDIDKWVLPFESEDIKWKGIYSEIVSYLGINSYSIQFSGDPKCMNILMDNCPENIDITFKPPVINNEQNVNSDSAPGVINNVTGGSMFAPKNNVSAKSNVNSMTSLKGNSFQKNAAKGMSSLSGNTVQKSAAKGMSSLSGNTAQKSTAKGMASLNSGTAQKSTAKSISSVKSSTAQKSTAQGMSALNSNESKVSANNNGMESIKNSPSARNNIDPNESKLSVPEAGWEDTGKGIIKELKTELKNIREYNSTLALAGLILCIVSAAGIILSTLLMSKVFIVISSIPALVFAVWAFKENYKKIAVTVIILDVLLAIIGWVIIYIRWRMFWGELADELDDALDILDDWS